MNINDEPMLQDFMYPVGTRYNNSPTYDEATNEVVHGWQVFVQKSPDGTLTGRKSFVDNKGTLFCISIAERKRDEAIQSQAFCLAKVLGTLEAEGYLRDLVDLVVSRDGETHPKAMQICQLVDQAREILSLSNGITLQEVK